MSQEELAQQLNLSRLTIHHLEAGRNATLETLLKVLKHFDAMDDLYKFVIDQSREIDINSLY